MYAQARGEGALQIQVTNPLRYWTVNNCTQTNDVAATGGLDVGKNCIGLTFFNGQNYAFGAKWIPMFESVTFKSGMSLYGMRGKPGKCSSSWGENVPYPPSPAPPVVG